MASPLDENRPQQRVLNPPSLENTWPGNQPAVNIYGAKQRMPGEPLAPNFMPRTRAIISEVGDDLRRNAREGDLASLAGNTVRGGAAGILAVAHDTLATPWEASKQLGAGMLRAGSATLGKEVAPGAPVVPAPAAPAKNPLAFRPEDTFAGPPSLAADPRLATPGAAPTNQLSPGVFTHGRGQYSDKADGMGFGTFTGQPNAQNLAAPTNQLAPGVFTHGRGQYSDKADGMGFGSFTGQPNAQNLAAADALSSRSQGESLARVTAASQPQRTQRDGLMDQLQSREIGARKTARYALAAMDQRDQNLTAQRGQDLSYDSAMRGHDVQLYGNKLTSASSRAKLQYDMAKDQRDYNLNAEKFGVEKASNSLKQREASDKAMREQVLGQLPQVKDATGKMVPDELGAAQYMRSAYARLDQRKTALTKELQTNPGNKEAAAELQSIGNYGLGTLSSDPQAQDQFLVGMQARSAARDGAGWMPWSGDRSGGTASGPITSLKWDPDSLMDGYRDQDNNWIPAHVIDQGGSRFGARTNKYDTLKRKD